MRETTIKSYIAEAARSKIQVTNIENAILSGFPDTALLYDDEAALLEIKVSRKIGKGNPTIRLRSSQIMFFRKAMAAKFGAVYLLVHYNDMLNLHNSVPKLENITSAGKGFFVIELSQPPLISVPCSTYGATILLCELFPSFKEVANDSV